MPTRLQALKAYLMEVTAAEYFYSGDFLLGKVYYTNKWKEF